VALLLPALSAAREKARSAACKNHLRQIGLALQMYVQDNGAYPPLAEIGTTTWCFDRLLPYYPVTWTNTAWHCPTYIAKNGIVSRDEVETNSTGSSYSYNWTGVAIGRGTGNIQLGLGHLPKNSKRETGVLAPSEMYAVADARSRIDPQGISGNIKMDLFSWGDIPESAPPHGKSYNMLFCDGHVTLTRRSDYLYPPRSASHWNCDNRPHPEFWLPQSQWAVQN
jgi:prepilin-type processing-associated H-X9-DG protein